MRPELLARWNTPDGLRRRERLLALGLRGPWREVLQGFACTHELGDERGDLRGIDLSLEELTGAELTRARLDGARLDDCGLAEARLDLATLSGASLSWARMERASLVACVAVRACWDDACLEGAHLLASNLTRGSFRRANLRGARLTGASLLKADLRCADLRGVDLGGCDLEEAWVACVQRDRPRTYAGVGWVRDAHPVDYPSFRDALHLEPRVHELRGLSRPDALVNVEAAMDASPDPGAELRALLQERDWRMSLLAAAGLVHASVSEATLEVLWAQLETARGRAIVPLTVAALLVDPRFGDKARALLVGGRALEAPVRASLAWAWSQKTGRPSPPEHEPVGVAATGSLDWRQGELEAEARNIGLRCSAWWAGLCRLVDPRIQALWHHPAREP